MEGGNLRWLLSTNEGAAGRRLGQGGIPGVPGFRVPGT